jgi:hypothetical protein
MTSVNTQAQPVKNSSLSEVSPAIVTLLKTANTGRLIFNEKFLNYEDGSPAYVDIDGLAPAEYWVVTSRKTMDEDGDTSVKQVKLANLMFSYKYRELVKVTLAALSVDKSMVNAPVFYISKAEYLDLLMKMVGVGNEPWSVVARKK